MTAPKLRLVPEEATEEIVARVVRDSDGQIAAEDVASAWSAMLAASPGRGLVTKTQASQIAELISAGIVQQRFVSDIRDDVIALLGLEVEP